MVLVYLLIFLLPIGLVALVIVAIIAAGANVYRTGKRAYQDLKPAIDDLTAKAKRAQDMGMKFAERGNNLSKNFEELAGRMAFITEGFQETQKSPVVKLAGVAGRLSGPKENKG
jgi:predicted PurR-regulated permease PerM